MPLFEPTNGGTRPTATYQEFIDAARRILEETDAATTRLKTRSRGESGRLTIGVHSSFSTGNLRATIADYRSRHPDVELCFVYGSSDVLLSDLDGSAVDLAVIAGDGSEWADRVLPIRAERIVIALPGDHRLTGQEAVLWHELRSEQILLPQRGPSAELLRTFIAKSGFHPHAASSARTLVLTTFSRL